MFEEFIDFARYVVSKEREESFRNNKDTDVPAEERLREITDADFENWIIKRDKEITALYLKKARNLFKEICKPENKQNKD